jgi:hypothetical protein
MRLILTLVLVFGIASVSVAQSNYVTTKEKERTYNECVEKGYNKIVGKTFIANPNAVFDPFREEPKAFSPSFGVRKPEKFTVIGYLEDGFWWKIRFVSGKMAYINRGEFMGNAVAVTMEDIENPFGSEKNFKNHPAGLIGKIETECMGCKWEK